MAEYIACRNCDSPGCKGCNLKNLETMLNNGKFDCLMNENHCINPSADVAPMRWQPVFGYEGLYEVNQFGQIRNRESALHNQCATPTIDAVPVDTVSKMFFDFTGDSCACDFNGNDEWLPEVCELQDECPYPKDHFGCWKQYIKHYGERKE